MYRYNHLWGIVLIAFGIGVLVGTWLTGAFFCHLLGFGGILTGCCILRRK